MHAYQSYQEAEAAHDSAQAAKHAKRAYELAEEVWGASERRTAIFATSYANQLSLKPDLEKARILYARCSEVFALVGEGQSIERSYCQIREAEMFMMLGRSNEAKKSLLDAIATLDWLAGTGDANANGQLGVVYLGLAAIATPRFAAWQGWSSDAKREKVEASDETQDHAEKARSLLTEAYGPEHALVVAAINAQAIAAEDTENWDAAARYYEESSTIVSKLFGAHSPIGKRAEALTKIALARAKLEQMPDKDAETARDGRAASGENCRFWTRNGVEFELCVVERVAPIYPPTALAMGDEGYAIASYDVSPDGTPESVTILESWPGTIFDQTTIDSVMRWKYKPPVGPLGENARLEKIRTLVRYEVSSF